MGRRTTPLSAAAQPKLGPAAAREALRAWARVQAPLCRLLLGTGIDYGQAAAELREVFLEQAHAQLQRSAAPDTDSALSLLSGVHRKDVRRWRTQGRRASARAPMSIGAQVFARWAALPGYRGRDRRPLPLPRTGEPPSFEALTRLVTRDVHPFTVLQEMARKGLVATELRDGVETVLPRRDGAVPVADLQELLEVLAMNLADHAAAGVANLDGQAPRLEQSVFADGLSAASTQRLARLARRLWERDRAEMVAEALKCLESDRGDAAADRRIRFGAYYWNTPGDETADTAPTQAPQPIESEEPT